MAGRAPNRAGPHAKDLSTFRASTQVIAAQSRMAPGATAQRCCLWKRRTGWEMEIHAESASTHTSLRIPLGTRQLLHFAVLPGVRLGDGHGVVWGSTRRI